jgi:hypothetical protein
LLRLSCVGSFAFSLFLELKFPRGLLDAIRDRFAVFVAFARLSGSVEVLELKGETMELCARVRDGEFFEDGFGLGEE